MFFFERFVHFLKLIRALALESLVEPVWFIPNVQRTIDLIGTRLGLCLAVYFDIAYAKNTATIRALHLGDVVCHGRGVDAGWRIWAAHGAGVCIRRCGRATQRAGGRIWRCAWTTYLAGVSGLLGVAGGGFSAFLGHCSHLRVAALHGLDELIGRHALTIGITVIRTAGRIFVIDILL